MQTDLESGRQYTFAQMARTIEDLAAGLQSTFGVKKGTMVTVALPVCAEYAMTVLAVNRCGGVASLINPYQTIGKDTSFSLSLVATGHKVTLLKQMNCVIAPT